MNRAKRFLLLIAALLITGACGCTETKEAVYAEEMRAEALAYLHNSYSDTFTAKVFAASNWAYEYESITFASEEFPEAVVEVRAYKNDDGTHRFKDNYYHCYMMDGAVDYVKSALPEADTTVKVRFPNTIWSDELADAETFAQWKEQGTACADIFVITKSAFSTQMQMEIAEKIAGDKVRGSVVFIATDEENLLRDKALSDILNNQSKFVVRNDTYRIDSDFEVEKE